MRRELSRSLHAGLMLGLKAPQRRSKPVEKTGVHPLDSKPVSSFRHVFTGGRLIYVPSDSQQPIAHSALFEFATPITPLELDDLHWYLEFYSVWPGTAFRPRADRIETELQQLGQALYDAVFANAPDILAAWQNDPATSRSFSIQLTTSGQGGEDAEAAAHLLSLPWELLHDGTTHLFQTEPPTCVRRLRSTRRLGTTALDLGPAGAPALPEYPAVEPPIRILLVTSRPETESCRYLDHRVSAEALVVAMETLGDLVKLTLLTEPTFDAMCDELQAAADRNAPYHVLHFDGHGTYSRELKQGGLLFEDPTSLHKLFERRSKTIFTKKLAADLAPFQLPLVFLEACQSAKAETGVNGSVASALLDAGVSSVVAMSHNVLVETARRFVVTFYTALVQGQSVGDAVLAGQSKLHLNPFRGRVFGAGTLELQDWFVPVLYQADADPVLFHPTQTNHQQAQPPPKPTALPDPPPTGFIGRSRELLALQRLLFPQADESLYPAPHWSLVRGQGGEGKTALATEFVRWSLRVGLIERTAFISVETDAHEEAFLLQLGLQLVGDHYLPAHDPNHQELVDALQKSTTLLIIDNCETLEPDFFHHDRDAILNRTKVLLESAPNTRLVFTSRETLPAPFDATAREIHLHRLASDDAKRLIERSLNLDEEFQFLDEEREQTHEKELNALIDATQGHARTLSLLAPHLKADGMAATTQNLTQLMIEMEVKFPGDREKSLFASIELSLQRLSSESRELCKPLGLFKGVANIPLFSDMVEQEIETVQEMGKALIKAGLAHPATGTVLHFHPAFCPYLDQHLKGKEREKWMTAWQEAMSFYVNLLAEMHEIEPRRASELILLARPNLLTLLQRFSGEPSKKVDLCTDLFQILQTLGQPHLLEIIASIRTASLAELGSQWHPERFEAERIDIEEQLASGDPETAQRIARNLFINTLSLGETAYPDAAFHIAVSRLLLGRSQRICGLPEEAIESISAAQESFDTIGDKPATRMSSVCTTEIADCLRDMGHFRDAATLYKIGIATTEKLGNKRDAAVGRFQLGNILMEQLEFDEALTVYQEAREIFEGLNEPENIATAWHQIGMVHGKRKIVKEAEAAFRRSLAIDIRIKNLAGQASTYGELGILHQRGSQIRNAVSNHQKAVELVVALKDKLGEARHRNNLANALSSLSLYKEARQEIMAAINCQIGFGHNAEPWKSWDILADIEAADPYRGRNEEIAARKQARTLFLDFRREGGEGNSFQYQLCQAIRDLLQSGHAEDAANLLSNIQSPSHPDEFKALHRILTSITNGSRDPSLAEAPELDYIDSVEVQLLVESLTTDEK